MAKVRLRLISSRYDMGGRLYMELNAKAEEVKSTQSDYVFLRERRLFGFDLGN